jgi:hypothetical protein
LTILILIVEQAKKFLIYLWSCLYTNNAVYSCPLSLLQDTNLIELSAVCERETQAKEETRVENTLQYNNFFYKKAVEMKQLSLFRFSATRRTHELHN